MLSTIENLFAALILLLNREASKAGKKSARLVARAEKHSDDEDEVVRAIRAKGMAHRAKLDVLADINQRKADRASALASKIKGVL